MSTSRYLLNIGESSHQHLAVQHSLYEASGKAFLLRAGLSPGMRVLEVGCGVGLMTTWIAEQVGNDGQVFALDNSAEQLEIAQAHAKDLQLNNIQFIVEDIHAIKALGEQFDFIYGRFILQHLVDTESVLTQLVSCLRPGGIIACEESLSEAAFCYPYTPAFNKIFELSIQWLEKQRIDHRVGLKLTTLFSHLKLEHINASLFQPLLLTPQQRQLPYLGLQNISTQIIASGLASPEEVSKLSKALDQLANIDAHIGWLRMHQVFARTQRT